MLSDVRDSVELAREFNVKVVWENTEREATLVTNKPLKDQIAVLCKALDVDGDSIYYWLRRKKKGKGGYLLQCDFNNSSFSLDPSEELELENQAGTAIEVCEELAARFENEGSGGRCGWVVVRV